MREFIQVVTTTGRREEARAIAEALVARRLAACVQVAGPVTSTYRWQGKVETAEEWQCWAKTWRDRYPEVEAAIHQLHPYDVPEIIALPVQEAAADYVRWLDEEVPAP
jgi:periplasmic divalent cation tolerance protein